MPTWMLAAIVTAACSRSSFELPSHDDEPHAANGDGDCVDNSCGDGVVRCGEACDDGNLELGDGCSATCAVQPGWSCAGAPSRCLLDGMVLVPAGSFVMGSGAAEAGRTAGTEDQQPVTLTHSFAITSSEVSQAMFTSLTGWNPSTGLACGPSCPVENVNWYAAVVFANALTVREGGAPCYVLSDIRCADGTDAAANWSLCLNGAAGGIASATVSLTGATSLYACTGFRLPTSAEWEYAARAGTATATYNGDLTAALLACEQPNPPLDAIAWFCGNSANHSHAPGALEPNAFGLYDMLGNVKEWCADWESARATTPVTDPEGPALGTQRIVRGGSFNQPAVQNRAAHSDAKQPSSSAWDHGFRVVRSSVP